MQSILAYERLSWLQSKVVKAANKHGYNGDVWADHPKCRYQSELTESALILIDARLGDLSTYERELTKRWATAAVMNHDDRSSNSVSICSSIDRPMQSDDQSASINHKPLSAKDLVRQRSVV